MGTSELDGSGRARSGSDRAHLLAATRPGFVEPSDDVHVLRQVSWPGLTRPLDELVAAPSGLWIVEHRPWQDIAVARGRVITADADVTLDVQHLDQVRVRVARDLGLTPVEAHALVVVPEEVPALRLEGVVIVGQRLVRQIILSPGRRLTTTQLDVLARRTAKVLDRAHPDLPQAPPQVAVVPTVPAPEPAPATTPQPTVEPAPAPALAPQPASPSPVPAVGPRAPRRIPSPTEPVPRTSPQSPRPAREQDVPPARPIPARANAPRPVDVPLPPSRYTAEPALDEAAPAGPEPAGSDETASWYTVGPEPDALPELETGHHDEPPPPLPTFEELGLRPALPDPPARRPERAADPIWPIAPPPGLWSAPEPEPELAQLVASVEPDLDEPDADEHDLDRTRVVESAWSSVPEVDEEESPIGRTRVVDYPAEPETTPTRGLPRVVEHAEPAWPSLDGPEPVDDELIVSEPWPYEPPVASGAAETSPVAEIADPADGNPYDLDDEDLDDEPDLYDDGPVVEGVPVGLDEAVELTRIRPPDRPPASQSLAEARRAFFSGASDDPVTVFPQDLPEDEAGPQGDEIPYDETPRYDATSHDDEAPGYEAPDDEAAYDDEAAPQAVEPDHDDAHPGRRPAPARPPTRLPVAWDDGPQPAAGPRPHVAWEAETPHRTARRQVAWDDAPSAPEPQPPSRAEAPRSDRRSVVAGPRPPAARPADPPPAPRPEPPPEPLPGHLPRRRVRPGESPSTPQSGPQPQPSPQAPAAAGRRGGAVPGASLLRPRPVRGGPWDLSPAQAAAVGGLFPGPARIRGAFGTGRSVAAAYRAVHLAHSRPGLVALVVPSPAQVEPMLRRLAEIGEDDVLGRIVVDVPAGLARTVLAEFGTDVNPAPESVARAWSVAQRSTGLGAAQGRSIGLVRDEVALIRGRSLTSERDYDRLRQEVPTGLRHQVWVLHEAYLAELRQRNLPDEHDLVRMARAALRAGVPSQFTSAVVDDANDLTLDQLTMVRETVGTGVDALTVVDDGLPGLLPVGATLGEAGIDIDGRRVDLTHEFRLTGPAWTSLVRLLQSDAGRDVAGAADRPRLAGRLDDGEGPSYLRSQVIRLRRDKLVERVVELVSAGVAPESIALLHIEDEPEPELVAELVRAGVMVRGLDALDVPGAALGRARDARGVEFDHVLVPDARHRDVVPVGGLRWDQRQRRRLLGLALSRARETAWIAGV